MADRITKSLGKLRDQINKRWPRRNTGSDGWIGDPAHRARVSDHNPNKKGHVLALDVTHDVDKKGDDFDSWAFGETLRLNRDPRIGYVISNGRIFSSFDKKSGGKVVRKAWEWGPYTGPNKHAQHVHVSNVNDETRYDDSSDWEIDRRPVGAVPEPKPAPLPPPPGVTPQMREEMGKVIVGYEARRDAKGHIVPFQAPDGGWEMAGVTQKDHPSTYLEMKRRYVNGDHDGVERMAAQYVLDYTKIVTGWVTDPGAEFMTRDTAFNRGQTGAAKILQIAVGFDPKDSNQVDGRVGPATRQRLADIPASDLLLKLRSARERYEDIVYPARRGSNQWQGMLNRWNNSLKDAQSFQKRGVPTAAKAVVATTATVATGGGAATANSTGMIGTELLIGGLVVALCVGVLIWRFWPRTERSSLT